MQGAMNFSRQEGKSHNSESLSNSPTLRHQSKPQGSTKKIVKPTKMELIAKLNSSYDESSTNNFSHQQQPTKISNTNQHSNHLFGQDESLQEQQQLLIHAPHPQPKLNIAQSQISPEKAINTSHSNNNDRLSNHQRVMPASSKMPPLSSQHQQSLSETRSMKSFKSLQDQRLARQLNRKQDTSQQNSNSSQTRQRSNVREFIHSQQEKLLFEAKFKGSLDKLDEFEKQWTDFKVQQPASVPASGFQSVVDPNSSVQIERSNFRLEQIGKLNSSFDSSVVSQAASGQTNLAHTLNYQTQRKEQSTKDLKIKSNQELKNELYQINESPRESILQSPSANLNSDKLKQIYRQPPPQKQSNQTSKRNESTNEKQKECKTLKIDLGGETTPDQRQSQPSKLASHRDKPDDKASEFKGNFTNMNKQQEKTSIGNRTQAITSASTGFSSQRQDVKKISVPGLNSLSNAIVTQVKVMESGRNANSTKNQISANASHTMSSFQQKDELVERVIESIKVLNQKEEEVKNNRQPISNQAIPKQKQKDTVQQDLPQMIQPSQQQQRKRTNTMTTGERPTLLQLKSANLGTNKDQVQSTFANNPVGALQSKENAPLAPSRHHQIAELRKQISSSNQNQSQNIPADLRKIQPASTTNQNSLPSGFIGNSFVKVAQEKERENSQRQKGNESKVERVEQNLTSDPYQYQNPPTKKVQTAKGTQNNQQQQQKTPVLSQASKDKVEQLRKAFTSNKDPQSRSTKNLSTLGHAQSTNSNQGQTQNIQIVSQKQSNNFTSKVQSSVSSNNATPINMQSHKNQQATTNSQSNLQMKVEKFTKRADINLCNDNFQITAQQASIASNNSNLSLNISANTPNKASIPNIKKSAQITPQSKVLPSGSPGQSNNQLASSLQQRSQNNDSSSNLHSKRNSQQVSMIVQSQNQSVVSGGTGNKGSSTTTHQKGKNRRQPTQTTFEQSSSNQIRSDQAHRKDIIKKQFELVEKPDGYKPKSMMDDYFQGSHSSKDQSSAQPSSKASQNNSKLQVSKQKDKSQAKVVLDQDLAEIERQFMEKAKVSNFQPIQQPSINWNPSPEKKMPEKKLFIEKKTNNFIEENSQYSHEPPRSHREYAVKNFDDRPLRQPQPNNQNQSQAISWLSKEMSSQVQQNEDNHMLKLDRIQSQGQITQKSPPKNETNQVREIALKFEEKPVREPSRKDSDQSEDSSSNQIEKRLNRLMEETRRRLHNQSADDEEFPDRSSSSVSEERKNEAVNSRTQFSQSQAVSRLDDINNRMRQIREKTQTPQMSNQANFQSAYPQQQNFQQQPYPYDVQPNQGFNTQYQSQQLQYQQYPNGQQMITILNPIAAQNMNYLTAYQQNQQTLMAAGNQVLNSSPPHPQRQSGSPAIPIHMGGQVMMPPNNPPGVQSIPQPQAGHSKNQSLIIGQDSKFFYNQSEGQNEGKNQFNQTDKEDNQQRKDALEGQAFPPKQYSQVILPSHYQNPLIIQHPQAQQQIYYANQPQYGGLQQPFFVVGYPQPQSQIQSYQLMGGAQMPPQQQQMLSSPDMKGAPHTQFVAPQFAVPIYSSPNAQVPDPYNRNENIYSTGDKMGSQLQMMQPNMQFQDGSLSSRGSPSNRRQQLDKSSTNQQTGVNSSSSTSGFTHQYQAHQQQHQSSSHQNAGGRRIQSQDEL